jgi:GrpB-like predicted nucleotidyltransferase (UPF0157 family)
MANRVVVVPYDLAWPVVFAELGRSLRSALGETALRIDHIGSTSIPGLDAKPIIDVQISVRSFDPLDAFRVPLVGLGFVFRADNPELTKRYFRERPGDRRTHIHVRCAGSWAEQFALLFRDYMCTHAEEARSYAEVKYGLAEQHRGDRHDYTASKAPFLWDIMVKADRWSQEIGWVPGPSDA